MAHRFLNWSSAEALLKGYWACWGTQMNTDSFITTPRTTNKYFSCRISPRRSKMGTSASPPSGESPANASRSKSTRGWSGPQPAATKLCFRLSKNMTPSTRPALRKFFLNWTDSGWPRKSKLQVKSGSSARERFKNWRRRPSRGTISWWPGSKLKDSRRNCRKTGSPRRVPRMRWQCSKT